jgi:hypothetical protein
MDKNLKQVAIIITIVFLVVLGIFSWSFYLVVTNG